VFEVAYGIESVRRVPNLIEPEKIIALAASRAAARSDQKRFCVAMRLEPVKRVEILLQAAALLGANANWLIDIVGDGSQRQQLLALAHQLNIGDRVVFHGWQANPYPIIASATALVLCSELEGFSNSVLEAMVLRTPVITSFCSSDARHMISVGAALGFEVGDHEQLCRHLQAMIEQPDLARRLGDAGWDYARPHRVKEATRASDELLVSAAARRLRAKACRN
jgi:glycosyltransferase involved in cell wall biosynthesis